MQRNICIMCVCRRGATQHRYTSATSMDTRVQLVRARARARVCPSLRAVCGVLTSCTANDTRCPRCTSSVARRASGTTCPRRESDTMSTCLEGGAFGVGVGGKVVEDTYANMVTATRHVRGRDTSSDIDRVHGERASTYTTHIYEACHRNM